MIEVSPGRRGRIGQQAQGLVKSLPAQAQAQQAWAGSGTMPNTSCTFASLPSAALSFSSSSKTTELSLIAFVQGLRKGRLGIG